MFVEDGEQAGLFGKVDVGFIDDDHSVPPVQQLFHLRYGKTVARGVVGRTEEEQLAVFVGLCQQTLRREGEVVVQLHFAQRHIVDVGRHAVHAVAGTDGDGVVHARDAEDAEAEVDGLVAAVADEDTVRADALESGDARLQGFLTGVGIAVVAIVEGIFVGVEENADVSFIFIACGGVGGQRGDVRTNER